MRHLLRKLLSLILVLLAGMLVAPTVLLALSLFLPGIPYLSTFGILLFSFHLDQLFFLALFGMILAFIGGRLGAGCIGTAVAFVGLLSVAFTAFVFLSYLRVAAENGAGVNVLESFMVIESAQPDETVTYTRFDGQALLIDIYQPNNPGRSLAPVVIYVHGGGWNDLDRTEQAANMRWFAEQGFLAVAMDYVLATPERATWNTAGSQVACAMVWIAGNASRYGGDSQRLFAYGASVGGGLVLTTTYAAASGEAESSCGSEVPQVRAVAAQVPVVDVVTFYENRVPYYGDWARDMVSQYLGGSPSEYPQRVEFVSPATYITSDAPPTLIILAADDHLVPIEGALQFVDQAEQSGVNVRAITFPWTDHSFPSVVRRAARQLILQHFQAHGG